MNHHHRPRWRRATRVRAHTHNNAHPINHTNQPGRRPRPLRTVRGRARRRAAGRAGVGARSRDIERGTLLPVPAARRPRRRRRRGIIVNGFGRCGGCWE